MFFCFFFACISLIVFYNFVDALFDLRCFTQGVFSRFLNFENNTKSRNAIHSTFRLIFNRKREINNVLKSLENICKGVIFNFSSCHILIFGEVTQFYERFR